MNRRVVITGIGMLTSLAGTAPATWAALLEGRSGVRALERADVRGPFTDEAFAGLRCRVGAPVRDRDCGGALMNDPVGTDDTAGPSPYCDPELRSSQGRRRHPAFVRFALSAATEALSDAVAGALGHLPPNDHAAAVELARRAIAVGAGGGPGAFGVPPERFGVALGAGLGSAADLVAVGANLAAGRLRRVSPYLVPSVLPNMPAGHASLAFGLRGPCLAPATACAAGAHAVGDAFEIVRTGRADVMLWRVSVHARGVMESAIPHVCLFFSI